MKVLLVDACRNDPEAARGARGGVNASSAPPPRGVAALFSCSAGQRAFEHESLKHGLFFNFVLEGLRGKAANEEKEISFGSLSEYVQRNVSRKASTIVGAGIVQSPNMIADIAGESPVLATGVTVAAGKSAEPDTRSATANMAPSDSQKSPAVMQPPAYQSQWLYPRGRFVDVMPSQPPLGSKVGLGCETSSFLLKKP